MSRRASTVFAVAILCLVAGGIIFKLWSDAGLLDRLRAQDQMGIEKLEILGGDGGALATVTDPDALRAFGRVCRGMAPHRSGRPEPGGETFEVHIHSRDPMDLQGTTDPGHPGEMRGVFLDRGEHFTGSFGAWRSAGLRAWIAEQTGAR